MFKRGNKTPSEFGRWLKANRENRGWSWEHLAYLAGANALDIYKLENGELSKPDDL